MKVVTTIKTYPDSTETKEQEVEIKSHWSFHDRIVICVGGCEYVIIASELKNAINNAVNH